MRLEKSPSEVKLRRNSLETKLLDILDMCRRQVVDIVDNLNIELPGRRRRGRPQRTFMDIVKKVSEGLV